MVHLMHEENIVINADFGCGIIFYLVLPSKVEHFYRKQKNESVSRDNSKYFTIHHQRISFVDNEHNCNSLLDHYSSRPMVSAALLTISHTTDEVFFTIAYPPTSVDPSKADISRYFLHYAEWTIIGRGSTLTLLSFKQSTFPAEDDWYGSGILWLLQARSIGWRLFVVDELGLFLGEAFCFNCFKYEFLFPKYLRLFLFSIKHNILVPNLRRLRGRRKTSVALFYIKKNSTKNLNHQSIRKHWRISTD